MSDEHHNRDHQDTMVNEFLEEMGGAIQRAESRLPSPQDRAQTYTEFAIQHADTPTSWAPIVVLAVVCISLSFIMYIGLQHIEEQLSVTLL